MSPFSRALTLAPAATFAAVLAAQPALADAPPADTATAATPASTTTAQAAMPSTPSANVVVNLIQLLVKQKVLSQKQAESLMAQAQAEAAQARTAQASAPQAPPPPAAGTIRVPYVPEKVRQQIEDNVRQEVLQEVQDKNWAKPEAVPSWTKHVKINGDLRVRNESDFYSPNNVDEFVDFATLNSQGPIDINKDTNPTGFPFLNTRVDRPVRDSFRARLNVGLDITEGVFFDMRLASGQSNSPVSTTQLFGGGFSKNEIWLDQAYLKLGPIANTTFTAGRMPDPFLHTDLLYDEDLNFDGFALAYANRPPDARGLGFGATAGIFPLEYGDANFPAFDSTKTRDIVKWMEGGQVTANWNGSGWGAKFGVGYYDFVNVRGQLSSPCELFNGNKACDTDQSRPAFMQKGNTLFLLRNIVPDPASPTNYAQPQFVGLSFDYNVLNATTMLSFDVGSSYKLDLTADYVRNLAYDPASAFTHSPLGTPVNNLREGATNLAIPSALQSGPTGFQGKVLFGHEKPSEFGEWNVFAGYRYLQPDAVLDSFTDSDFHLGGTNAKGYFVGGAFGLFHNTNISARWLSANQVYGPPLAIDVFQLDLNTGF